MSERETGRYEALEERYPGITELAKRPELLKGVYTVTQSHPEWDLTAAVLIEQGVNPPPDAALRGESVYGGPVSELLFPGEALAFWDWEVRAFRGPKLECRIAENDGGKIRFHRYGQRSKRKLAERGVELREPLI